MIISRQSKVDSDIEGYGEIVFKLDAMTDLFEYYHLSLLNQVCVFNFVHPVF